MHGYICVGDSCTSCCLVDDVAKAPYLKETSYSGVFSPILLYLHELSTL